MTTNPESRRELYAARRKAAKEHGKREHRRNARVALIVLAIIVFVALAGYGLATW